MSKTPSSVRPLSARRKLLFWAIAFAFSLAAALGAAEVLLRLVPIPGIKFHTYYYDSVTGGRYYPNTVDIYRNDRNDYVRRRVNGWGYLDVDHDIAKKPGTIRIGFFGDSYTQAAQVPIEQTFFRLIEAGLNETSSSYECVAFGVSGRGMLQSYLDCVQWMDSVALDWVVYVFVENDLGDQIPEVKRSDAAPYPVAAGDSFVVDYSFRKRYGYKASRVHRMIQFIKANSLVVSTLETRIKLLKNLGIKTRVTAEERQMAERGDPTKIPGSVTAPSTWPDTLAAKAERMGSLVLAKWQRDVERSGKRFAVLYIPREREMHKPYAEQDAWASWLTEECRTRGIPLIDPSRALLEALQSGREIFYDHLAPGGHEAVAKTFVGYIKEKGGS